MDEIVELPASAEETAELASIVVRQCGCGCSIVDGTVSIATANCSAARALRDRRFVLGLIFARKLRRQLVIQEWLGVNRAPRHRA